MKEFLKTKNAKIIGAVLAAVLVIVTVWYVAAHRFIDGKAYAKNAEMLDLRGREISAEHYDAVRAAFPDIEIRWDVIFQGKALGDLTPEVRITELSDEDVATLDYFTALEIVDARGCTDYAQLEALIARRPEVEVLYTVTIDGETYDQDATHMQLNNFTAEELALIRYLPELTAVRAEECEEFDLLLALQEQYPDCRVTYNVPIGGIPYPEDTRELVLSDVSSSELMDMMQYLPQLETVTLQDPRCEEVNMAQLQEQYPHVDFYWEMDVFGLRLTCEDTQADFSKKQIESVAALEQALASFPNLDRVYLGRCGLDNEELAAYRDRVRPEYKVVWNILIGALFVDTDETWFMPGKFNKGVTEEQAKLLKYCEDMVCIDVGHKPLETCEFVRYMPNLKYLILADTNIEDITPLETCKNLVFLELFMSFVKDYTPLLGCTALEDLNIAYTWGDPEPIKQMTWLKRLWWNCQEELTYELSTALPNTELMLFSHPDAVAYGWRLGQHYYDMRDYMGVPYM